MKSAFFFFFGLIAFSLAGQNLVQNGSFESRCNYPQTYYQRICNWQRPPNDFNTPDLFKNSTYGNCSPCTCIGGDHTFAGNTYAYDGQYFLGMVGYYVQGGQQNGRENIQTELSEPLVGGTEYLIGFAIKYGNRSAFAINNFGLYLSDSAVGPTNQAPTMDVIRVTPQLDLNRILPDSAGWTVLSKKYVANGGERFLTIGNFTCDSLLSVIANPHYDSLSNACLLTRFGAYYFIDDVFVKEIDSTMKLGDDDLLKVIEVYPNPAREFISVKTQNDIDQGVISIIDQRGRLLYNNDFSSDRRIEIPDFDIGMYLVKVVTAEGIFETKLIISD